MNEYSRYIQVWFFCSLKECTARTEHMVPLDNNSLVGTEAPPGWSHRPSKELAGRVQWASSLLRTGRGMFCPAHAGSFDA